MRLRTRSALERQKPGRPATRPGARHQSGSDDIRDDHGVDAAGVWVIDVPRAVAQQDSGRDFHDTAVVTDDCKLDALLLNMVIAVVVLIDPAWVILDYAA